MTVTLDGTVHRLSSSGSELPGHASAGIQLLSGIQLADAVAQGEEVFLLHVTAMGDIYEGMPGRQTPILPFSELHTVHADEGHPLPTTSLRSLPNMPVSLLPYLTNSLLNAQLTTRLTLSLGLYLHLRVCTGCRLPSWQS